MSKLNTKKSAASPDVNTATRKIQIVVLEPDEKIKKEKYELLYSWTYMTFKSANIVVNHQWFNFIAAEKIKQAQGLEKAAEAREILKQIYDTGMQNSTYRIVSDSFPELPSSIRTALNNRVGSKFNSDMKDVLLGRRSLSNYKYGMPIPFNLSDSMIFKVEEIDGQEEYTFSWLKGLKFVLRFGKDKSNNRIIVDRIMSGEYKFCDSEIMMRDNKFYLMLTHKFKKENEPLDYGRLAATNLGMNCPIFVTVSDGTKKEIGTKEEFLKVRLQFQKRRTALQKELVSAQGGHGRDRKLKALDHLGNVEANFAKTYNHKLSHLLIDFCVKNRIGSLVMEDLLGAGKTMDKIFVLRNWSYYPLQSDIKYKAKLRGIKVMKASNADYTQMCDCCKNISKEAVDLEKRVYRCVNENCEKFKVEVHLDENNSLNLLHANLEKVAEAV